MVSIRKEKMVVSKKYKAELVRAVIPSEVLVEEGSYAVYHSGKDLILKFVVKSSEGAG